MSNAKLHPAIAELRRFLNSKGDVETTQFISDWLVAWCDVYTGMVGVKASDRIMFKGTEEEYQKQVIRNGFFALGVVIGQECAESIEEKSESAIKYTFAAMAFRKQKKTGLVSPSPALPKITGL